MTEGASFPRSRRLPVIGAAALKLDRVAFPIHVVAQKSADYKLVAPAARFFFAGDCSAFVRARAQQTSGQKEGDP